MEGHVMAAIVDCPLCSRKLRILDAYEGEPVKCPTCGGTFVAPIEAEAASVPAASALIVTETIAPLEIGPRQAVPPVPKLKPRLIGEEKVPPSRPPPGKPSASKLPLRLCTVCGRQLERDATRCTHCGEPLGADDDRPWPYRDCEPHRGGMILALGIISIVLITTCVLSIIGLPMGIAAWTMAQGDLRKMRAGRMDPDGMRTTESGRTCAIIGTVLNALGVMYLAMMFAIRVAGARF
jgi:hypothetical protein